MSFHPKLNKNILKPTYKISSTNHANTLKNCPFSNFTFISMSKITLKSKYKKSKILYLLLYSRKFNIFHLSLTIFFSKIFNPNLMISLIEKMNFGTEKIQIFLNKTSLSFKKSFKILFSLNKHKFNHQNSKNFGTFCTI